mmetsp:Transcript_3232/g.11716  ORF Transcript_3232/g.11716 Transcript_3232/m.11716 type:complete len:586 (-) Transcript_3232:183-1940(-)
MEAGGTRLEATGQAEPGVRPHVPPGSAVAGGSPGPPAPLLTTLRGSAEELHAIGKEEDEMQLEERGQVASVAQSDEPAGLEPTRARFTAVLANLYTCGTSALHALKYNSLRSLSEYIRGNSTAPLSRPLWLLGVNYDLTGTAEGEPPNKAAFDLFKADWFSRIWITYRKDFQRIQDEHSADMGWGCMFRTGQMMLAQGLLMYHLGRHWRYQGPQMWNAETRAHDELIRWFGDSSSTLCPFSIHNIISSGGAHGVKPGQWLGPYSLCRTLEALINRWRPGYPGLPGMAAYVVCGEYIGASPELYIQQVRELCEVSHAGDVSSVLTTVAEELVGAYEGAGSQVGDCICTEESVTESTTGHADDGCLGKTESAAAAGLAEQPAGAPGRPSTSSGGDPDVVLLGAPDAPATPLRSPRVVQQDDSWRPLLILVPLTLGAGPRVNPLYIPSLKAVLQWPQSIGMIGGRPAASLYFVGFQEDNVFYLDPHTTQPTAVADDGDFDSSSYHCSSIRHMPFLSMDPSLALGFLCRAKGEFEDLCERITHLAAGAGMAPLFTVAERPPETATNVLSDSIEDGEGHVCRADEDWQIL